MRNLFKVLSAGGDPGQIPELKDIYPKYKIVFDIFDVCVDARYGNFLHLPFSGGAADQGAKTMDYLKYIRHLFREKIAEEEKKGMRGVGHGGH
jgi:hypothetical protein